MINIEASLGNAEKAHESIRALLSRLVNPNLFDMHPPFQIDGNFGFTSGVTEMLLQSHAGEIQLLPALPALWQDGSVTGLRARGGIRVDLAWQEGKLKEARLTAAKNRTVRVRLGEKVKEIPLKAGVTETLRVW